MSNSELEDYVKCLNSVMLAMKGGATVGAILKTYEELNGRKCNVTKFGFPNVETLFKAFPDYFYSQDGLWYGQVTEASEDVVRSMVTEKSKRKGWNPLKGINSKRARETAERCTREQRHSDADSRIGVQKKRLFPEMGSERGIEDREAPTQFDREPSISRVLPFSSADGNLPDQSVLHKSFDIGSSSWVRKSTAIVGKQI